MRAVPLLLVAIAFGAGAYAFTASNTFSGAAGGSAGAGSAIISGYDIGTPTYTQAVGDDTKIHEFTFHIKNVSGSTTLKAGLVDPAAGPWAPCVISNLAAGEGDATCTFGPGDDANVEDADNLTVIGVN